ncbi:uncharacterized protein LOC111621033 [Centruroides sculpturatus]|uniref:uncharacterized protein LOC111621033 n=1 Tax=Centruroides sculpturatus TaxID=218467 RepID=UPI000C6D0D05|nr:uncharacterized protein LOC111621033 [Centruroides sculpturatus]
MSHEHKQLCLDYILAPIVNSAKVSGMDFCIRCKCMSTEENSQKHNYLSALFAIYSGAIELFLWIMVLLHLISLYDTNLYGLRVIHMFNDHALPAAIFMAFLSIYTAVQFSALKRSKISLHCVISSYEGEWKLTDRIQVFVIKCLCVLFFMLQLLNIVITIAFYRTIKQLNGTDTEAFICVFMYLVWFLYIAGQNASLLLICVILLMTVDRRLINLSLELLKLNTRHLSLLELNERTNTINTLMWKHQELWEFAEMISERWNIFLPFVYAYFLHGTCFLLYAALFTKMELILKIYVTILSAFVLSLVIVISWVLSYCTKLMYDNFISIEIICLVNLPLLFKFKVNDFMKRFGKNPIGISCGGFFYVKRNFVIRVLSALDSFFSSIVEITGVLQRENKCLAKYGNSTRATPNATIIN